MDSTFSLAKLAVNLLKEQQQVLVTAESCTGGGIAQAITSVAGSSLVFNGGYVTYSDVAKTQLLTVSEQILQQSGAVSPDTVAAMAEGAFAMPGASVSVAVSGVAGPDGGSQEKPVGTVEYAFSKKGEAPQVVSQTFAGDRREIRIQAVDFALAGVIALLKHGEAKAEQITNIISSTKRLFFALWPSEETRQEIAASIAGLDLKGCKKAQVSDMHLTLNFLGRVDLALFDEVFKVASEINFSPFSFNLNKISLWQRSGVLVLEPRHVPAPMQKIVTILQSKLNQCGFKQEKRNFRPHITLAHNVRSKLEEVRIKPIKWQVNGFCLAQSTGLNTGSRYQILKEWS